jgi:50S ribosomal protein L16 3-hydroxylase
MNPRSPLLGGLTVSQFLRDYWQKKPLLIRQAMPRFRGLLDPQQLMALACDPDAQARAVVHRRNKWELYQAPFVPDDFSGMEKMKWTVLVQGVNHYLPEGAELLKQFNFIPHARLDDLMVSYAPKGGGVGPHFDSYDVFLLQGLGHRRWQISTQADRTLIEGAPLRILKDFRVEQEWVLEPGDMLYLPPHCAHNGIAEDDCMTYSIGFRTPAYQELAEQFLVYMQDRVQVKGMYADPNLKAQRHPSEIGPDMLQQVSDAIKLMQWRERDIASFLGSYLSEPKPHIFFDPPKKPLNQAHFEAAFRKNGVELNLKTQMLCCNNTVFINGAAHPVKPRAYRELRELADHRLLPPSAPASPETLEWLYQMYRDGYITAMVNRKRRLTLG